MQRKEILWTSSFQSKHPEHLSIQPVDPSSKQTHLHSCSSLVPVHYTENILGYRTAGAGRSGEVGVAQMGHFLES